MTAINCNGQLFEPRMGGTAPNISATARQSHALLSDVLILQAKICQSFRQTYSNFQACQSLRQNWAGVLRPFSGGTFSPSRFNLCQSFRRANLSGVPIFQAIICQSFRRAYKFIFELSLYQFLYNAHCNYNNNNNNATEPLLLFRITKLPEICGILAPSHSQNIGA